MDDATKAWYAEHAHAYSDQTWGLSLSDFQARWYDRLPKGAHVLDAGCGSGRDALAFWHHGYQVSALDGSPEMAQSARARLPLDIEVLSQDFSHPLPDVYDAIWACASLVHTPHEHVPSILRHWYQQLSPQGLLYVSLKEGEGSWRDGTRLMTGYAQDEARSLLETAGFEVEDLFLTKTLRPGRDHAWINLYAKKT